MSQTYYVVDAGALLSPWKINIRDAVLVTTSNIINEIRNRPSQSRAEIMILLDQMQITDPTKEYVNRAKAGATHSGDISIISENDIELVALALMLNDEGKAVVLVSSDFAVLNVTSLMGLNILDPTGKFGQEIIWGMRCPACHYLAHSPRGETECPICGTEMRRTPLKKRKVREYK